MEAIDIQTNHDLLKIEQEITNLSHTASDPKVTIRLARNLTAHFFKQTRVAALFATAAQKGAVQLHDWYHTWDLDDANTVYRSSVAHFAGAIYSNSILNQHGAHAPFKRDDLATAVAHNGGILEPHNITGNDLVGRSLSFCSVDPDFTEPLTLAGLIYSKKRFVDELTTIKRRDLDCDQAFATPDLFVDDSPDKEIAGYVFELYQNGYEHGNRSRDDKKRLIPGLRFISIRKHVAANFTQLAAYARGFSEVGHYIGNRYNAKQTLKYYEVAVSDQGLGMLDRFLIDRPEYLPAAKSRSARLVLLKKLLTETLTSKKSAPGAGGGLVRALRAARALNGFISIRTGEFWLACSFDSNTSTAIELAEVNSGEPSLVAGTHFNALFPLRR